MPPEDQAAWTHEQVLLLLLHEGLQGRAADEEFDSVDTRTTLRRKFSQCKFSLEYLEKVFDIVVLVENITYLNI